MFDIESLPSRLRTEPPATHTLVTPSGCAGGCGGGEPPQTVYALGQLGLELVGSARRDAFAAQGVTDPTSQPELLAHLESHPEHSTAVTWTLEQESTPVYVLHPGGPFAAEIHATLREFLADQLAGRVEQISVPGKAIGTVAISSGQRLRALWPEERGLFSWSTPTLVEAVLGKKPKSAADRARADEVANFLDRIYYELRNPGVAGADRAINFAATNAFQAAQVFTAAIQAELKLGSIEVESSPICRPGSECWDVKMTFFHPDRRLDVAREVFRFTVDVSDQVPVTVGAVRRWHVYA